MKPRISCLERLCGLPSTIPWSAFEAAIVHAPHNTSFLALNADSDIAAVSAYPSGTAFGALAEVRWRKRRQGWHWVLISDEGLDLGAGSEPRDLSAASDAESVILWGEKTAPTAPQEPYFYEGRIPHKLCYPACAPPVRAGGRLALRMRGYWFEDGGRSHHIYRYAGFASLDPPAAEETT
ncbi:MAG: hypothetical protein ABSF98_25085 [Bryobacteraceae bacterium]|jgi:hypothetical protein